MSSAAPGLRLRVMLHRSPLDARRGVVRLNPQVLQMLGMRPWDPLALTGQRTTAALAAPSAGEDDADIVWMDDLTCANAGVAPGEEVAIAAVEARNAATLTLSGSPQGTLVDPLALRFALLGKVLTAGDRVSLLPQDFALPGGAARDATLTDLIATLSTAFGHGWRTVVLKVEAASPGPVVRVTMETVVSLQGTSTVSPATPVPPEQPPPALSDLPGLETQAETLLELLDLGFHQQALLAKLGTRPQMGVLITGPPGSGKAALARAAAGAVGAAAVRVWGPALARLEPGAAASELRAAFARAEERAPAVLLIEDVDALAPRQEPGPLLSVLVEETAAAVTRGRIAIVCTTAHPEATASDLRRPGVLDLEIEIPVPQRADRVRILEVHTRSLPLAPDVRLDEVASRTPGFIAADLMALAREAALRAAQRAASDDLDHPVVTRADFDAALEVVKPSSLEGLQVDLAALSFDDVGDMDWLKEQLTELVIWPLRYPETFERLGIEPPTGALLYGPPGCGKTFIVKALANEAEANFLSVKGAELLSKWVGESERAVRELFRRARAAAPALIFFDELDALAPARGAGEDTGATDRVVAQLLTELDGVEELHGVFCIGATNRPDLVDPALLRPGRLERLIWVPPPDAAARAAILTSATRRMPVAEGVDLAAIGAACEGFSAADLEALARAAAMSAMRANVQAPVVDASHFEAARATIRPSLRADQVAALRAFAARARG